MYQTDRGSYRTKETIAHQFTHSCLGQIVICVVIISSLLIICTLTQPSQPAMQAGIRDDIRQCLMDGDSLSNDWIDDIVANAGYIFTSADTTKDYGNVIKEFDRYNSLRYYDHTFLSTIYLHNNFMPEGKRCGIGILGMVIPWVNYNDFLLHDELMRTDTINTPLIDVNYEGEFFGENPGLEPFRYKGE